MRFRLQLHVCSMFSAFPKDYKLQHALSHSQNFELWPTNYLTKSFLNSFINPDTTTTTQTPAGGCIWAWKISREMMKLINKRICHNMRVQNAAQPKTFVDNGVKWNVINSLQSWKSEEEICCWSDVIIQKSLWLMPIPTSTLDVISEQRRSCNSELRRHHSRINWYWEKRSYVKETKIPCQESMIDFVIRRDVSTRNAHHLAYHEMSWFILVTS